MLSRTLAVMALVVSILAINAIASARDAVGNLTFIQSPLSTAPQFAQPGGTITVDVAERIYNSCGCAFHLYLLVDDQHMELDGTVRGTDPATSTYRFSATIPAGLETGLYDLVAVKGANKDTALHAVSVAEEYPSEYSILHVHDPRVAPGSDAGQFLELTAELAGKNNTAFVVITGTPVDSLSEQNTIRFFEITGKFPVPTLVADPASNASQTLPRVITFAESMFLLADPLGDAPETSCAESVIRDFIKQGKISDKENQTLAGKSDSLYFGSDGTIYHIISGAGDDDCLKTVKDTFATPPLSQGKARVLAFKDGKLIGNKLIDINP